MSENSTAGQPVPARRTPASSVPSSRDAIDLFEIWDFLWSERFLLIPVTVLGTLIAVAYALYTPPVYQARVVFMPAEEQSAGALSALTGQFGGLASLAGIDLGGGGGQAAIALETLESFQFTAGFLEDERMLPVLFSKKWDAESGDWKSGITRVPTLQDGARKFAEEVRYVYKDKLTGVITLTIAWTDPDLAARWANALLERLNDTMRSQSVVEAQRAVGFLQEQADRTTNVEMKQTLYRLIEAQTKTMMLADSRPEYAFRIVDPAFAPERPSKPRKVKVVFMGAIMGGFIGILAAIGRRVISSYRVRKNKLDLVEVG